MGWYATQIRFATLATSSLPIRLSLRSLRPVIKNSLKIWLQFRKHFHFNQAINLLPLLWNHLFPPSQTWHRNGLVFVNDLFADDLTYCRRIITFLRATSSDTCRCAALPKNASHSLTYHLRMCRMPYGSQILVSKIYQALPDIDPPSWESTRLTREEDSLMRHGEIVWDAYTPHLSAEGRVWFRLKLCFDYTIQMRNWPQYILTSVLNARDVAIIPLHQVTCFGHAHPWTVS